MERSGTSGTADIYIQSPERGDPMSIHPCLHESSMFPEGGPWQEILFHPVAKGNRRMKPALIPDVIDCPVEFIPAMRPCDECRQGASWMFDMGSPLRGFGELYVPA